MQLACDPGQGGTQGILHRAEPGSRAGPTEAELGVQSPGRLSWAQEGVREALVGAGADPGTAGGLCVLSGWGCRVGSPRPSGAAVRVSFLSGQSCRETLGDAFPPSS